jgi:hypothetical protein
MTFDERSLMRDLKYFTLFAISVSHSIHVQGSFSQKLDRFLSLRVFYHLLLMLYAIDLLVQYIRL